MSIFACSQNPNKRRFPNLQAFYAERAFRLMNKNYWVLAAIIVGMCCQFSASIAVAMITAVTPGFDQVEVSRRGSSAPKKIADARQTGNQSGRLSLGEPALMGPGSCEVLIRVFTAQRDVVDRYLPVRFHHIRFDEKQNWI